MSTFCSDCVNRQATLGLPSYARWLGPDGGEYCSMHYIQRFGHGEPLVRIEGFKAPSARKPPAPRKPRAKAKDQVKA